MNKWDFKLKPHVIYTGTPKMKIYENMYKIYMRKNKKNIGG